MTRPQRLYKGRTCTIPRMALDFPLPPLTQERFTKYFNTSIDRKSDEVIVYPGEQLQCSTKTNTLKKKLKPKHIFITRNAKGQFFHRVLGDDGRFQMLPKRLYAMCYPQVSFASVPDGNRVRVRLSSRTTITLPYIPDSFYEQKRRASQRTSTRPKRAREPVVEDTVAEAYRGWNPPEPEHIMTKKEMMAHIRTCIHVAETSSTDVPPPFTGELDTNKDAAPHFATIVKFVYHYCREELGMPPTPPVLRLSPPTKKRMLSALKCDEEV